jgi:hypothetical protein
MMSEGICVFREMPPNVPTFKLSHLNPPSLHYGRADVELAQASNVS